MFDDNRHMPKQTTPNTNTVSRESALNALQASGYLVEARVEALLEAEHYYVEPNAIYPDPDTGKAREFDLFGMVVDDVGPNEFDLMFTHLFIECINNPQPLALLTRERDIYTANPIKMAGIPVQVISPEDSKSWESLADYFDWTDWHHYARNRYSTQYCTFRQKGNRDQAEWMAYHDDDHFQDLRKLCAAVDHAIGERYALRVSKSEDINLEVNYPILVVQGELLEMRVDDSTPRLRAAKHLLYRQPVLSATGQADFIIDVVTEAYLPKLLELISQDTAKFGRLLRRRREHIRKSVDALAASAYRLRSSERVRSVLAFE